MGQITKTEKPLLIHPVGSKSNCIVAFKFWTKFYGKSKAVKMPSKNINHLLNLNSLWVLKQPTKLQLYSIYPHKVSHKHYPELFLEISKKISAETCPGISAKVSQAISKKISQQICPQIFTELSANISPEIFPETLREVKGRQDAQQKHQSPPEFEQPLSIETANQITVV